MKTRSDLLAMLSKIEGAISPGAERMALIMAIEWAGGFDVSTSLALEDWLDEQNGGSLTICTESE